MCLGIGVCFLFVGFFYRRKARRIFQYPRVDIGSLSAGQTAIVSGMAISPILSEGQALGRPCLFSETIYQKKSDGYNEPYGWVDISRVSWGGFFVKDRTGMAFVAPSGAQLEFLDSTSLDTKESVERSERAGFGETAIQTRRKIERRIDADSPVFIVGSCRPLSEFLDFARNDSRGLSLPAELMKLLLDMARNGEFLCCFFAIGTPFMVAGSDYEKAKDKLASSGSLWLSIGLALIGWGAVIAVGAVSRLL